MDEDAYASPCVRNCCLDREDICLGCYRSIDEILAWTSATPAMRKKILAQSQARRAAYLKRQQS